MQSRVLSDELQEKLAKEIHGDFSEYNIFKTKKGLIVFDFSSAEGIRHTNAIEFLERDIKNITTPFYKESMTVENPIYILKRIIR